MADYELTTSILDSLPFAVTTVSPEGTILFVNHRAAENLSATRDSVIGTSLFQYFPDLRATTRDRIRQAVAKGVTQHFEAQVVLPNGNERRFATSYAPTVDADGRVTAVQIIARDVSEQRSDAGADDIWGFVTDEISMTRERIKGVLDNAPIVIGVYDLDATIRYMNRVVQGVRLEDVLGQSMIDWLSEESKTRMRRAFDEVINDQRVIELVVQGITLRTHWLVRLAPLIFDGQVRQILGCTLDITEQKRLEAHLLRESKTESLGVMARGIAHDFNNLLTAIMANTGLARHEAAAGRESGQLLDEVDLAARRAADLCEQMMVYAGRDPVGRACCQMNDVITEIAPLNRAALAAGIEVGYTLEEGIPAAACSASQLSQVVLNLVNNAADAIGDGPGTIRVSTSAVTLDKRAGDFRPNALSPGRYVQLRITDSGTGLSEEALSRMFDPFYSTKSTGHGLGLSVVLGILSSHDAGITVEAAQGVGTTATVLFRTEDSPQIAPVAAVAAPSAPDARGTVLVVDDEPAVRRIAARILEDAGYDVVQAADGDAALAELLNHGPRMRAVLLDVTMPVRDGYSTLRELRARYATLPVVLSSGRPLARESAGPHVHELPKPYAAAALLEVVGHAIRESDVLRPRGR